jgi:ribosome-associated translation inhibitor RaiA
MNVPPQVIFHDMDRSQSIEDYVLERIAHVDKITDGLTSARVTLTRSQGSHQHGNEYRITIEVRFPPHHDLAARKERNVGDAQMELRPLIKQAFEALEKQVKEAVAKRRNDVKAHDFIQSQAVGATMPEEGDEGLEEPRATDEVAKQNERAINPTR